MITPATIIHFDELKTRRDGFDREGARVAFVPTMGALHAGHLALVNQAKSMAERVVVSIFVNPAQFGPGEDFEKYPRTLKADLDLLTPLGVDAVFLPNAATMYPDGFQTFVHNKVMSEGLCGAVRPGHFEGVLTVVMKLFNLVRPHVAIFGKKDYQQWRLIARMAEDLALQVQVIGAETLRESDGLAMSSRNRYLSPEDRVKAACLSQGLMAAKEALKRGQKQPSALIEEFMKKTRAASGLRLEYAELRRQEDLSVFSDAIDAPCVMIVAARLGTTRLIDNMELG